MKYFLFILLSLLSGTAFAQQDSLPTVDTAQRQAPKPRPRPRPRPVAPRVVLTDSTQPSGTDSLIAPPIVYDTIPPIDSVFFSSLRPWSRDSVWSDRVYRFTNPVRIPSIKLEREGKESIFYSILGLLIVFALIRNSSRRYIQDLLRMFFRTSVKQKQLREQLMQNPLPSLLLNIFFVISTALFTALAIQYLGLATHINYWWLFLYCMAALVGIYTVKLLVLKLLGWIFQMSEVTDTYIFVVFTTNKVIGILLLPFTILLAFSFGTLTQVSLTLAFIMVGGLFAYRYFLSYLSVHRQMQISLFHFLLYLVAFEIAPLLLINKLLFMFLREI